MTSKIARQVYDDFHNNKSATSNTKLCKIRQAFEKFNLVSGLHSYMSKKDKIFENLLPVLDLLPKSEEKKLFEELKKLDFNIDY